MSQNILECGPDMDNASLVDIITETLTAIPASGDPLTIKLSEDKSGPRPMARLVYLLYCHLTDIECSLNVLCLTSYFCIQRGDATVRFPVDWIPEHVQSFRDIMHFYMSLMHKEMTVQDLAYLVMLSRASLARPASSEGVYVTNVNLSLFQRLGETLRSNNDNDPNNSPEPSNESKETKPLKKNKNQPSE